MNVRLSRRRHPSEDVLIALLDGELEPPEREDTERHLFLCSRCSGLLARQRHALQALAVLLTDDEAYAEPADVLPARWQVRPAVGAAGAGVLAGVAGIAGALMVAGLLARRHRRTGLVAA